MKLMKFLLQLFWRYAPHTCRFDGACRRIKKSPGYEFGMACRRCGNAVWFHVRS